jgi:pimeloyl-ACP methyl ester carboxylesterase
MDDWSEFVEEVGPSVEIVALDFPGFGKSGALPRHGAGLLDAFADLADAATRLVGWQGSYYVVGHSHGAGVALTMAARHPASIGGLILMSTLGVPAHASYRQLVIPGVHGALRLASNLMKTQVGRGLMRSVVGSILAPMFHPFEVSESYVDEQMSRFIDRRETLPNMALLARGNPSGQLARDAERVRAPALFLHGEEDRVVPVSHAAAISQLIARGAPSTLELIPGAGHMLHRTHAEETARRARRWFDSTATYSVPVNPQERGPRNCAAPRPTSA